MAKTKEPPVETPAEEDVLDRDLLTSTDLEEARKDIGKLLRSDEEDEEGQEDGQETDQEAPEDATGGSESEDQPEEGSEAEPEGEEAPGDDSDQDSDKRNAGLKKAVVEERERRQAAEAKLAEIELRLAKTEQAHAQIMQGGLKIGDNGNLYPEQPQIDPNQQAAIFQERERLQLESEAIKAQGYETAKAAFVEKTPASKQMFEAVETAYNNVLLGINDAQLFAMQHQIPLNSMQQVVSVMRQRGTLGAVENQLGDMSIPEFLEAVQNRHDPEVVRATMERIAKARGIDLGNGSVDTGSGSDRDAAQARKKLASKPKSPSSKKGSGFRGDDAEPEHKFAKMQERVLLDQSLVKDPKFMAEYRAAEEEWREFMEEREGSEG